MRGINLNDLMEEAEFAKRAARCFSKKPDIMTFSDKPPGAGEMFAVRWGLGNDCVLIFRIDENMEPINFHQLVRDISKEVEGDVLESTHKNLGSLQ